MVGGLKRVSALLCLALVLAPFFMGPAQAQPKVDPGDLTLSVEIDAASPEPYVGEMILVTLRGTYDAFIALEKFEGIELPNFTWIQLGRDVWSKDRVNGRLFTTVERRLALYAEKPGQLAIGPFRHHLTLDAGDGTRFTHDVVSETATITITPKPTTNGGWWFPAKDVTLVHEWNVDPAQLANDATAIRTVTITAVGQPAEALPPPPRMRAPWLISFIAPEERSTELTPDGPVGTVRWQWRMRPSISQPGELDAFHIPWFDMTRREMRDVVLPSQRIAYAAIEEASSAETKSGPLAWALPLLLGLALPAAFVIPQRRLRSWRTIREDVSRFLPRREDFAMRWAIWQGDTASYRRLAAKRLRDRGLSPEPVMSEIDAQLYGGTATSSVDLRAIHRKFRSALKNKAPTSRRHPGFEPRSVPNR
ncbi:hypothetical protein [Jiella marina]|uniref:hypothetical protein n=1 Tax=Jiella sp. LLJ827 TaxID=2917712 RepID=UPI002100A43B|nr:hypothetical protein [Jiella sp. LLJ827]MCQ0987597.1 hypothetical protein [Jiella sp. LLJ827]